jgi:hypothetical protein
MCSKEEDGIEVDSDKMFRKLEENLVISNYCTAEIKKEKSLNQKTSIVLMNYSFLVNIIGLHLMLVSFVHNHELQLVMMLVLELGYVAYHFAMYLQLKHFRSIRFFIPILI